jgi:hypothetical protein
MTRRRLSVIALVAACIGIQWLGPKPIDPRIDAGVRLEATANVPPAVLHTLRRACYDCHSSETRWPWYTYVAPASWLVISDVRDGRKQMNFSRWGRYNAFDRADMLDKVCDRVSKGRMPVLQYRLVHWDARLSGEDVAAICAWTKQEAARLIPEGN